jgi:hypothetical protein
MPKNSDDPNKIPYQDIAKVRNVLLDTPLKVFTALPQHADILVVSFKHTMCLN